MLNEALINNFNNNYPNYLNNYELIKSDLVERFRRTENQVPSTDSIIFITALEHYIASNLENNTYSTEFEYYKLAILELFKNNPNIAYDSILMTSKYAPLLFSPEDCDAILKFHKESEQFFFDVYIEIKNGVFPNYLPNINKFYLFMIANLNNPKYEKEIDDVFGITLNKILKKEFLNFYSIKEFLLKYTAKLTIQDLRMPERETIISHDINFNTETIGYQPNNNSGFVVVDGNLLNHICSLNLDIESLFELIMIVSHELKHSHQEYDQITNKFSNENFEYTISQIFEKYLSTESFDEYKINYYNEEIELDSYTYQKRMVIKIINKYCNTNEEFLRQVVNRFKAFADAKVLKHKYYNRADFDCSELYNTYNLDQLVTNFPELLDDYPILHFFYNKTLKQRFDFFDLLLQKNKKEREMNQSFNRIYYGFTFTDVFDKQFDDLNEYLLQDRKNNTDSANTILKELYKFGIILLADIYNGTNSFLSNTKFFNKKRNIKLYTAFKRIKKYKLLRKVFPTTRIYDLIQFEKITKSRFKVLTNLKHFFQEHSQTIDSLKEKDIELEILNDAFLANLANVQNKLSQSKNLTDMIDSNLLFDDEDIDISTLLDEQEIRKR